MIKYIFYAEPYAITIKKNVKYIIINSSHSYDPKIRLLKIDGHHNVHPVENGSVHVIFIDFLFDVKSWWGDWGLDLAISIDFYLKSTQGIQVNLHHG